MTPKLTLNLGLRYDLQDLADPTVNNPSAALAAVGLDTTTPIRDRNNFGPRFGFSYAFDDKTVYAAAMESSLDARLRSCSAQRTRKTEFR